MKILQTPVRFYPYIGGVENYVYYLSKELVRLGHQVKVICADEPHASRYDNVEGVSAKRLNYIGKIANTNITLSLPFELISQDFDIIHTHLPTPWSADISAAISLIKNKPLILTYHNNIIGKGVCSLIAKSYNLTLLAFLLKSAKKIIITHKRYIEYALPLRGYLKKVEVIPVGVDVVRFKASAPRNSQVKRILFIALLDEFHRYKGLDYLIQAMVLIMQQIPEVKLLVVGEGSLKEEYIKLAKSLKIDQQIDFVGHINDDELVQYYNNCDVFVLPSISCEQEGFGIVLLEAMSCAKPVVTTNITGLAEEIKEAGAGVIIEPKNINSLSESIVEVLRDQNYAREMGRRAREVCETKYSWNTIAVQIERLYAEVIS